MEAVHVPHDWPETWTPDPFLLNFAPHLWSRLKRRLIRLGTEGDLVFVFSDTCCSGLKDPSKHPVTAIFSSVVTGPKADKFHKVQLLTASARTAHPSHATFAR